MEQGAAATAAPQQAEGEAAQHTPEASSWRVGLMVQVLHEDGKWYDGQLSELNPENGKWHILFDDGDRDWYTLPDRDVRVVAERQSEQWQSFLQRYKGNNAGRDDSKDLYAKQFRANSGLRRQRQPQEVFGTCQQAGGQAKPIIAPVAQPLERWNPLTVSPYMHGPDTDGAAGEGEEARGRGGAEVKRKRSEAGLSEKLMTMPEAKLYTQLVELEEKIDAVISRKELEFAEELKAPTMTQRTLQVYLYNTHENQGGDGAGTASWTLHITGRLLDSTGKGGKEVAFTDLFDRVFVDLPAQDYPGCGTASWARGGAQDGGGGEMGGVVADRQGAMSSLKMRREGSKECKVKVQLHPLYTPARYTLKDQPELSKLLGWKRGTWASLLLAFWGYVRGEGLQDEDSSLYVKLDEKMQHIFEEGASRMPLTQVGERLWEFVSEVDPVELEYTLCLSGEATPAVYEVLVEAEDEISEMMREFVDEGVARKRETECATIEGEIADLMIEIEAKRRKRDFLNRFAESPAELLDDVSYSMSADLATVRTTGLSQFSKLTSEEVLRSEVWQQFWTEEAALHYLSIQGHGVCLNLENTLAEEDASAFAATVAAAHATCHAHESGHKTQTNESAYAKKLLVSALPPPNRPPPQMPSQHFARQQLQAQQMGQSQPSASTARQPPPPPPVEGGPQGEGEFLCELCQRFFKSEHALTVHKSTSQYHKQDKRASVGAVPPQQPQTMGGWAGGGTLGVAGAWKK